MSSVARRVEVGEVVAGGKAVPICHRVEARVEGSATTVTVAVMGSDERPVVVEADDPTVCGFFSRVHEAYARAAYANRPVTPIWRDRAGEDYVCCPRCAGEAWPGCTLCEGRGSVRDDRARDWVHAQL